MKGATLPGAVIRAARSWARPSRAVSCQRFAGRPIVALVAGILILLVPRLLNFIVAIYLIIIGVTGLWPHLLR